MNEFYKKNYAGQGAHLGGVYPFIADESPNDFFFSMESMINFRKRKKLSLEIDEVALVEKTCLPYMLHDRTLLKNVKRAPWMHSYENQAWVAKELPEHGMNTPDRDSFSSLLKAALLQEAADYIGDKKSIGILLSGGMDSRIVAGVVRELQENNHKINVVGITWGNANSRDVVYSQRICEQFGWEFVHYPITAETLHENIKLSAKMGAEVSALHFHAMNDVANLKGVDVILAGSYGDSVGRAEFSGNHVTKLRSILPNNINRLGLVKSELFKAVQSQIINDSKVTNHGIDNKLRMYEIEQECHYMRRMLQSCMHVIAEKKPLYQMFSDPNVFGLMWGLDPKVRDNEWYSKLLAILPGDLLNIPWARTGKLYHLPKGEPDHFEKRYHQYGLWLRTDLKDEILTVIDDSVLKDLGVFNIISLNVLRSRWQKVNTSSNNQLDETVSWLASLHYFIKTSNESLKVKSNYEYNFKDYYNALGSACYTTLYASARNFTNK